MSTLYIVGTPIGNLEDVTQRALRVLREVGVIAAEDTRTTRRLLDHYAIHPATLVTYTDAYERGKEGRLERVLAALGAGQDVALVSDAGMPGLSDPGYELTTAALAAGHILVAVPGPSAITTALAVSGLPAERFRFLGFLPRRRKARRELLAQIADDAETLVAFETPHRLQAALADLLEAMGDRPLAVARELTKRHEEVWRGPVSEAIAHFAQQPVRGEVTLVVAGAGRFRESGSWTQAKVVQGIVLLQREGLAPAAIARVLARLAGWQRNAVYDLVVQGEVQAGV